MIILDEQTCGMAAEGLAGLGNGARLWCRRILISSLLCSAITFPLASSAQAQVDGGHATSGAAGDGFARGFANPPAEARPRVWWHWMNGNITKEGIDKDLDWMKRVGIGGLTNFDANLVTPRIVDRPLVYMTPEWKDAFRHAAGVAERLGLEMTIASSPGWSETGGPWVPPADAMKKLVWSETPVRGGHRFAGKLAPPPSVTGPFQDLPLHDPFAPAEGREQRRDLVHYRDVAVLAFRSESGRARPAPRVRVGAGDDIDAGALGDGRLVTTVRIARGTPAAPTAITLSYPAPQTVRTATLFIRDAVPPIGGGAAFLPVLEAWDGSAWRKVAELPLADVPTTVAFAPVMSDRFRVVLGPTPPTAGFGMDAPAPGVAPANLPFGPPKAMLEIGELRLSTDAAIDRFEAKGGFSVVEDYDALGAGPADDGAPVSPAEVVDLTSRLKPDGSLAWTPPRGNWRILRLGYSLLGKTNHPAPAEATGLEVDKLDAGAVRRYLETYLGMYRDAAGEDLLGRKGVRSLLTDSTEVGAFNWTPRMIEQFRRLRGYDPTPWLPTLAGVVVGSRAQSDAFLYDFRRTIADLHASEHYGTVKAVADEHGLSVYGEALEAPRPSLGDDMAMRAHADIPMAALWTFGRERGPGSTAVGDMKGAASVAHLYGRKFVAAESMTSALAPWAHAPADLRRVIDFEFANGINRPVIHTSVHQPLDDKVPGVSLFIFGQYFNRHETWAEMARPWVDYIARNSYALQQGRDFADVLYFYGEEEPLTALFTPKAPADLPTRYAYDLANPDVLLHRIVVEGNELVAASGARYSVLHLGGDSRRMTLPVLRRVALLAEQGATIVGRAPEASPSLNDDKAEFAALVRRLWAGGPVTQVGAGRVIAGNDAEAALASIGVGPDFAYSGSRPDSQIVFVHRRLADGDLYFVNNRRNRTESVEARFRVTGKAPEIWRADTGATEPVSYRIEGEETVVPLDIAAEDSFFVLFRTPAAQPALALTKPTLATVAELDSAWDVAFEPGRGAPAAARLDRLASLSHQADPGIRYFSGVATYTRSFTLPRGMKLGAPLLLDLGTVGDLAEVRVNGQLVGTAWHAPYRIDIGKAVRAGTNRLEIRVANLWVNRLIGDAQPGVRKITFTTQPTYTAEAPLRPSGLIGPVTLLAPSGSQ